jgi:hypothetical protein
MYHHHPVIYDNDMIVPPQFVRVVAPADFPGLVTQPHQMWINQPAPGSYSQLVMQSPRSTVITSVDRGSDAIRLTKSEDKSTQICPADLQTNADTHMDTAAKLNENWEVPDVKPGEKLHGWEDCHPSPEKEKSRSREKNQPSKFDTTLENFAFGNNDNSVSKREKSQSPSKKGKSWSPAKKLPVPLEKFDHDKIDKDIGMLCRFL